MKDDDSHPPTPDRREQFLTSRQLAAILQVSETTVRRLAREGRIPSVRITPRILRFHLQSVREALDGATPRTRSARRPANDPQPDDSQLSFTDIF
ncbi:MAG TPA: helix-turn-helix domain-containing protein [Pyrinomonadaceae bacterium]|nr:helix-turn-helix domain-containing protein [Pyrinomonadaceae bacterium]